MLKMAGLGSRDGKPLRLLMLGLSYANLARLKAGQPIDIDGAELGMPDTRICIFAGATELSMAEDVRELIGPNTQVKVDPRLRN